MRVLGERPRPRIQPTRIIAEANAFMLLDRNLATRTAVWRRACNCRELAGGADFDVPRAKYQSEFKGFAYAPTPSIGAFKMSQLTVLYGSGFDLVLKKSDKPAGHKLCRRLADEVLPRLRRAEPVGAPAAAALQARA